MGRAENSVFSACQQVCQIYHTPFFRIHSRVIDVVDKTRASGVRPFKIGTWKDELGNTHNGGMSDGLALPRISIPFNYEAGLAVCYTLSTIPLWIETKAKTGQRAEQVNFQKYVESCGAYYLLCRDSADPLLEWFKEHGVTR